MADRKPLKEKSKPFTTFNQIINTKFSVCGDVEFQTLWSLFWSKENQKVVKNKSKFLNENLLKDMGEDNYEDFLDSFFFKEFEKTFWIKAREKLSEKGFNFGNKQDYLKFIIEREQENRLKKEEKKSEKTKK